MKTLPNTISHVPIRSTPKETTPGEHPLWKPKVVSNQIGSKFIESPLLIAQNVGWVNILNLQPGHLAKNK